MRKQQRQRIGEFWLWQRPKLHTWYICWLESDSAGRGVTRRKSIAARGGSPDAPPQEAVDALAAHYVAETTPRLQAKDEALVEALMSRWLRHHVSDLAAPERYVTSVRHWIEFFDLARQKRWIRTGPVVADLTPELQARFKAWRAAAGVGGHTISRDLASLRGALSWAWKHQLIEHPPFIADVPTHQLAPPRDRVLTFEELGAILNACAGKPDREHLIRFIVIELGTAGRPQAVLELTDANIDLEHNLINPNQPGELHLRKRRAIVPIAKAVLPWVSGIPGKIIKYRVPITKAKTRLRTSRMHLDRKTVSIKNAWKGACADAKVAGATPKTLRHTMLTWLAERGVPYEQRQMLAGHRPVGTTARNYEHLSPNYLKDAIKEVDAFFCELRKFTTTL